MNGNVLTNKFSIGIILVLILFGGLSVKSVSAAEFLYVFGESVSSSNMIFCYKINSANGNLTALDGFPVETGFGGSLQPLNQQMAVDRVNKRLYVVNSGAESSISAYSINTVSGALTELAFSPINLSQDFWTTVAVHPSGSPLVVGGIGLINNIHQTRSYQITADSATEAPGSPYFGFGGSFIGSSTFSQNGSFFYTTSPNGFAALGVSSETGVLTSLNGSPFDIERAEAVSFATDSTGRLFFIDSNQNQDQLVRVFTTDAGIPMEVKRSPFSGNTLAYPTSGKLSPNEKFYTVTDQIGDQVAVYQISGTGADTTVTPVLGSPFPSFEFTANVVYNSGGNFLYAITGGENFPNVTRWNTNSETGVLTNRIIESATQNIPVGTGLTGIAYLNTSSDGSKNPDTIGVFRPSNGITYLRNSNTGGFADIDFIYGNAGDISIAGDWDGNGKDTLGIYRNGVFYLRNSNTTGSADIVFAFGDPTDQPIAGDWNGDGVDTIGVYRQSTGVFFIRNSNTAGEPDAIFVLGNPNDIAISGDWDGDGIDTTGVFRPSNGIVFLKNTNTSGDADIALVYGNAGDKPIAGDWDGDGIDTVGIYRNGIYYLRNSNTQGFADLVFAFGNDGDDPIEGDWDGLP